MRGSGKQLPSLLPRDGRAGRDEHIPWDAGTGCDILVSPRYLPSCGSPCPLAEEPQPCLDPSPRYHRPCGVWAGAAQSGSWDGEGTLAPGM